MARKAGLLLWTVGVTACGTIQVDPPESRALVGSCQQLSQPAYLIKQGIYRGGGLKVEHLIFTEEYRRDRDKVVGSLEKGTQLTVRHVVKDVNMTASCWRIEVEIASGPLAQYISQLPACYKTHPPTWLNSDGPSDVVEQLRILPEYAVPCATDPVRN